MIASVKQLKSTALQMTELMRDVPKQIERLKQEIDLCEKEENDLRHQLELTRFNAYEGYMISRDFQITLIKRRELKDELDSLIAVKVMMGQNRPMLAQAEVLSTTIKQKIGLQKNRTYTPRVRTDLAHKFNRL